MELIEFNGKHYPAFQSKGFAARWTFPFANEILSGRGYDIGPSKLEWKLPDSDNRTVIPIDLVFEDDFEAMNLPIGKVDFIFSSHCLEHLPNYVDAIDYWVDNLKSGGMLFLYLPHYTQEYWLPFNNRKHIHSFNGRELEKMLIARGLNNIFLSGVDLNNSFTLIAQK